MLNKIHAPRRKRFALAPVAIIALLLTPAILDAKVASSSPVSTAAQLSASIDLDQQGLDAWLETPQRRYTSEEVLQSSTPDAHDTSFGYRKEPLWIRFPITHESALRNWRLLIHPQSLRKIDLTVYDSLGAERQKFFYQLGKPPEAGVVRAPTPTFELTLEPGQRYTAVAKLQALEPLGLDIRLEEPHSSETFHHRVDMFLSIYIGALIALMMYNAFIYRTLRERFFIPYLGLMGSLLFLVPNINGILDYLFAPTTPFSNWIAFFTATSCLCGNQFSRHFLRLSSEFPKLDRIQKYLSRLSVVLAVQSLPPFYLRFPEWIGFCSDLLLVSTVSLIMTCGINASMKGKDRKSARYFLIAWTGFLLSCVLFIGVTQGLLPNTPFSRSIVEIFNILEMVILSFAISDRVKELETSRMAALQKAWNAEQLDHLFKMVCHDIANPLQVVFAHAQLAARGKPINAEAMLHAIREQEEILKFARRQSDSFQASSAHSPAIVSNLGETIDTLRFTFERTAQEKGVTLRLPELSPNQNWKIKAEPVALAHGVLGNALSNAIKFSKEGQEVRVIATIEPHTICFTIEDDGPGIPPLTREALRGTGKALPTLGARGETGNGYGFQLMNYFIQSFGAKFEWESQSAEDSTGKTGTRIRFTFHRVSDADV